MDNFYKTPKFKLNFRVFFNLCDGIFLNYGWKASELERTDELVNRNYPDRRKDVFFGIDIFQRGQIAGFRTNEVDFIFIGIGKEIRSISSRLTPKSSIINFPLPFSLLVGRMRK